MKLKKKPLFSRTIKAVPKTAAPPPSLDSRPTRKYEPNTPSPKNGAKR